MSESNQVYVATPVSVEPKGPQQTYWTIDFGGAEGESRYDRKNKQWSSNVEFWLRPVQAKGLPTRDEFKNKCLTFGVPSVYEADIVPLFVALQQENEKLKAERKTVFDYDKALARDNAEKKQEIEGLKRQLLRIEQYSDGGNPYTDIAKMKSIATEAMKNLESGRASNTETSNN